MEHTLATIRQRRAELARLRERIEAEDKELEVTERVLTRLAAGTGDGAKELPPFPPITDREKR